MMDRLLFVCLIFSAFSMVFVNSTECKDSAITVRKVESCPQNVKEWKEAAARKGCEKMTCSSFEYHCVINAWGNETIEVCAPRNVCSEYNIRGKRLQRNDIVPCEKCPPFYFSNESFKYSECYEYVKKISNAQTEPSHIESMISIVIGLSVPMVVLFALLIFLLFRRIGPGRTSFGRPTHDACSSLKPGSLGDDRGRPCPEGIALSA